jgi:hypothetical protein
VPGLVGLRHRVALSSVQSQHKVFPRQELAFAFVDIKVSKLLRPFALQHITSLSVATTKHLIFSCVVWCMLLYAQASESNAHSSSSNSNWRVLSQELNSKGIRQFVAWQWSAFEQWYLLSRDYVPGNNKNSHQHYYEVIREGCPCRLYFDLEFQRYVMLQTIVA